MPRLKTAPDSVAAVDLGSNSFHLVVAKLRGSELQIVDRLREMVRLAEGLTSQRSLSGEAQERALACLERFGQRLRDLPAGSVRAVGTNTLRAARHVGGFLARAEKALGHPIEIISGIEEARLIYQGVSQSFAADGRRRLVMDIGGGSTEYIIGVDQAPLEKESLHMGCLSMSLLHFENGKITAKRFRRAVLDAQLELEPFQRRFHAGQWEEAIGASGTIRAVRKILVGRAWTKDGISLEGLNRLIEELLAAQRLGPERFSDLNPDRYPSFPGGVAILFATFNTLGIRHMHVSDGALREGLLYDLRGRLVQNDIRGDTVAALAARYHVDPNQVRAIRATLDQMVSQLGDEGPIDRDTADQWLGWAANLHEIGLDIAHSQYHKHGAYIIANADLPGFSRQDQLLLAMLVRAHRRKFPNKSFSDLPPPWDQQAKPLAVLLRLAILLNRSRQREAPPKFTLRIEADEVELKFPPGWLEQNPLPAADLEEESEHLRQAGIDLTVE